MIDPKRNPVIVAGGQITDKTALSSASLSTVQLMEAAISDMLKGSGMSKLPENLNDLIVVNSVASTFTNPPAELAKALGVSDARLQMTVTGGNTPQMLVNHACSEISQGKSESFLLVGAEALDTLQKAKKEGLRLNWPNNFEQEPALYSHDHPPVNDYEGQYGLYLPSTTYPLIENALRHHYGRSIDEHQNKLGELFSQFSQVAADNPDAWFPIARTAQEIAKESADNRFIAFPYTKYMNAILRVNQAAAVLIMSEASAKAMGISSDNFVYLHGAADVNDIWNVSERPELHRSPAIELGSQSALAQANKSIDDIKYLDLYSCFPSVVQIARDALGIAENDGRSLTMTGGLPYFGGPGNNYVMHSIVTMVNQLKEDRQAFGLLTGNGWYITKHSFGIYSAQEPESAFVRTPASELQNKIDSIEKAKVEMLPHGSASVETYTVLFDKDNQPTSSIIIGRLDDGKRFLAKTSEDRMILESLIHEDPIGLKGQVSSGDGLNLFEF